MTAHDGLARVGFRPATLEDCVSTYDIFVEAADDLAKRSGWAPTPRPSTPPERLLAFRLNALRNDPAGFWVAEADDRPVGFGIAVQREHVWYLAALHVRPTFQSRGVGAEIVRRCLEIATPGSLLTVGADARNPASNALYGRFGMFPEMALVELSGPARPGETGFLVAGAPATTDLAAIDRAVYGADRPQDHVFWGSVSTLRAYSVVHDRRTVGYAYVQTNGAIGPIGVLDPADLAPALDASIAVAAELGATSAHARIPGNARSAIALALAHGWRYGAGATLVLTSASWGRWDRYITSGGDALL